MDRSALVKVGTVGLSEPLASSGLRSESILYVCDLLSARSGGAVSMNAQRSVIGALEVERYTTARLEHALTIHLVFCDAPLTHPSMLLTLSR